MQLLQKKTQIKSNFSVFAIIYCLTLLFLGLTVIAAIYFDIPPSFFARDPVITLGGHPFTGMQSHLGVLVLFAASAICFFSFAILRFTQTNKVFCSFLIWSGAIAGLLALDDLFLFHEYFFPRYLGLEDKMVIAIYGIVFVIYLIKFRKNILKFEPFLMCSALVFLGLAVAIDDLISTWNSIWRIFFEDGFKLLGIVSWSSYLTRTCWQAIVNAVNANNLTKNDFPLDIGTETTENPI
jgi:hypothetical protein